jgi:hypothetical protein
MANFLFGLGSFTKIDYNVSIEQHFLSSNPVKINLDLNTDNRVDIGGKIASLPLNFDFFWASNPVKAVYSLI